MTRGWWIVAFLFGPALVLGCGAEAPSRLRIGVLAGGGARDGHESWPALHAGAQAAANELNVDLSWQQPGRAGDAAQQATAALDQLLAAGAEGLLLAPADPSALAAAVERAAAHDVPAVVAGELETGAPSVAWVGGDPRAGGELAARRMAQLLGGPGKVVVLGDAGVAAAHRQAAFVQTLGGDDGVELVIAERLALRDPAALLARAGDAVGAFAASEAATIAMLRALRAAGRAGEVQLVGFGAAPELQEAMRKGDVHGLVLDDPFEIGYLGTKAIVTELRGGNVQPRIDTGFALATKESMRHPDVLRLLQPDLSALRRREPARAAAAVPAAAPR